MKIDFEKIQSKSRENEIVLIRRAITKVLYKLDYNLNQISKVINRTKSAAYYFLTEHQFFYDFHSDYRKVYKELKADNKELINYIKENDIHRLKKYRKFK